jgi:hypothetical protein
MQPPTRRRVRRVFFAIALLVLGFMPISAVFPHEPPAAVHPTHAAVDNIEYGQSERRLERGKRALFVILIIADQLQAGRQ